MLSGAERGSGGPRLRRHLLNTTDNDEVTVGVGRNLAAEGLAAQLREMALNGGGCRTRRTLYHVHLDPDPAWSEADRRRGEALWWQRFEAEFGLADAAYSEVRHAKYGRAHTHRVYDLAGGRSRLTDMSFDRYRRQRLSAEVAHELGLPCPPIAHPRQVIRELEKRGRQDVADHVRATWRRAPGPEHTDLAPPAGGAAAAPRAARRDGVDPEVAPLVVAPVSPRRRMQRDRTGVDPGVDVNAQVLAAIRSGDNGPARAAALRDAGLPVHMGDRALVALDSTGNTHPLLRALNAALKAAGEAPLRKRDLDGLLAGAEIAPLPAAGARPKRAGRPAPAPQPVAAPAASDDLDGLTFPTLADLDAVEATLAPMVVPAPAEVPARTFAPPANADAYRGAEEFGRAFEIAFGPSPVAGRPVAQQRPRSVRAPADVDRGRRRVATGAPQASVQPQRPAPAPFVTAIGADLDVQGWEAEPWWSAVIKHLRAWLRGDASKPVSPPLPPTPQPEPFLPPAGRLLAFRYADNIKRRDEVERIARVLENAGVGGSAEAGEMLVGLREGIIARAWNPATLARYGDAAARQWHELTERSKALADEERRIRAAISASPMPRVPSIDALWVAHCKRRHGGLMERTEADIAKAKGALATARQAGDGREVGRWESALSILANERHRLVCRLRAERGGLDWKTLRDDAAEAPALLHEPRARHLRAVQAERGRVAEALRASDKPTGNGVGTRPGYTNDDGSIRRPPRPAPPSDEATPPRPKG